MKQNGHGCNFLCRLNWIECSNHDNLLLWYSLSLSFSEDWNRIAVAVKDKSFSEWGPHRTGAPLLLLPYSETMEKKKKKKPKPNFQNTKNAANHPIMNSFLYLVESSSIHISPIIIRRVLILIIFFLELKIHYLLFKFWLLNFPGDYYIIY